MNRLKKSVALFSALAVAVSLASCQPKPPAEEGPVNSLLLTGVNSIVTYELTGECYEKEGFAEGTVKFPTDSEYVLYWADANGNLANYEAIATESDGEFTFDRNVAIPEGATSLVLCKSGESTAIDAVNLPESKQIKQSAYLDFASISDVHVNKSDKGAPAKLTAALNWFNELQLDYVFLSGDITNEGITSEYKTYVSAAKASSFPFNNIFESRGNHDVTNNTNFLKYTSSDGEGTPDPREIRPNEKSPYYYVLLDGGDQKDNLFIFLCQEMNAVGDSPSSNNFSDEQLDWFEGLLETYSKTDTNIFVVSHTMFYCWGPGDRYEGGYGFSTVLSDEYVRNLRYRSIVSEYKECIIMNGHSHLSFYENYNFDDEDGTAARIIHNGSVCDPRVFVGNTLNSDHVTETYGSEAYAAKVYPNYVIYNGANVSNKQFIPTACIILETYNEDRSLATSIEITTQPDKTNYAVGDYFDARGMVVTATLADGSKKIVKGWGHDKITSLKANENTVTINYGALTATVNITVGNNYTNSFKGEGTVDSPYLIETAEDFMLFTENMRRSTGITQDTAYGKGLYFRQTANIDLTGIVEYDGLVMTKDVKYGFAGVYDGSGYSITASIMDFKSYKADDVSIFPYVSGVIMNLEFGGAFEVKACQPIYSICSEGLVVNCISNMDLDGGTAHGLAVRNDGTVSRWYGAGVIHADKNHGLVATKGNGKYVDVFTNAVNSDGEVVSSSYATAVTSPNEVLGSFSSVNADVLNKLGSFSLNANHILAVTAVNGQLRFANTIISMGNNIAVGSTAYDDMGTDEASNTVDGNTSTHWQYDDKISESAWLALDFGSTKTVNGAKIYWESDSRAVAGGYVIQYTVDGANWQNVPNAHYVFGEDTDVVEFGPVEATGVRVYITAIESTKYMPKIYELEVYGN